ncbi:MAG: hypothetical protein RR466_12275 [Hungatella sp.]
MKKKILVTGLMMTAMLMMSACGSKNTTAEITTVSETTAAATTAETTAAETTTVEVTTTQPESTLDKKAQQQVDDIRSFAEEIQITVANQDIEWLADLCNYPVYVSLKSGEGKEVQDRDEFLALGTDEILTEALLKEIAAVDLDKLEPVEAGVVMGDKVNIIFSITDGNFGISGINS